MIPIIDKTADSAKASNRPSVTSLLVFCESPSPIARAKTDEVPAPRPIPMLSIVITTGNVKLIAASSIAPNCATNQVSTTLKDIIASIPQIIGRVMARRCSPTGPSVSNGLDEGIKFLLVNKRFRLLNVNYH